MSSNSFAGTIDLTLRPSVRALKWLFALHLLPVAVIPFAMEPGQPMILLAAAFAVSWMWLRRHPVFGFGPRALVRLMWHAEGHWTVREHSGLSAEAELLGSSYIHPRLLVLNFRLKDGSRRSRAILGDEASEAQIQRLQARLLTTEHL
jgi:toxin CptA